MIKSKMMPKSTQKVTLSVSPSVFRHLVILFPIWIIIVNHTSSSRYVAPIFLTVITHQVLEAPVLSYKQTRASFVGCEVFPNVSDFELNLFCI